MNKNSTFMRLCMALLLAVLTTAVRADVVPFTESYNAESTTDGWTSSVAGRFTPMIYNEADFQQGASDNYFLSVNQSERYNNGCVVTGTILSGKAAAGDDFTLEFDMRLCNSSGSGSQSPVSLQIKDADNDKDIFALSAPEKYAPTWDVNGTDLQVTLPDYGGQSISALTWCHYVIARSGNLTYLTITNNATDETILERTLVGGSSGIGGLGNIVFTTKRYYANFAIDNIVVRQLQESDVPSVEMSSYTIKYHNESGDEIAADIVTPYIVGGEATANDGQLAPIYYNDKKYLYKEGNSTITLVGDAAQNVITLVYSEAKKCSYTVKALYGGKEKVLLEGSGFEGDVVTYNYPEYILDGTTLYLKNRNTTNPYFGNTITLSETSTTEYVEYADGMAEGVVFYKEAEQIDGFTPLTTNNADIRCSDGKGGIIEGDDPVVLTTLPAGTYTIYGQIWGTAGYTATITAGEQTVWELETPGYLSDATTELTLTEETTLYITDSGDLDGKRMLDLIYIQESKPHYIAEYNLDQATLTFKQGTLPLGSSIVWDAENTGSEPGWLSNNSRVRTVVFDESFVDARPTSCALWFRGASTLTTIVGLEYLNTSEATSMAEMFRNCQQLTTLDLSTFDTKNVTDMYYMFYNDYRLTSLNVSSFNTAKVENMSYMFGYCSALQSLDVSGFNTSEVRTMPAMFMSCLNLTQLDLSNFNTSKVTDMLGVFYNCASLTSLDLSSFNTSNVERMASMFSDCSSLKTINVGEGWNTTAVTNSGYMFSNCTALIGGAGTTYDAEHTDAEYARIDGGTDAPGYFTGKNATPVVNPEAYAVLSDDGQTVTFYYDTQKANRTGVVEINQKSPWEGQSNAYGTAVIAFIDASFDNYLPTSTKCWFMGCGKLTSISGMDYLHTSNVTDMIYMFQGCSSLTSLDVSNFNTSKVTRMASMFSGCSSLISLDVSNFNTSNVTDMEGMFYGCSSLTSLDVSNFNTDNVKYSGMSGLFYGCNSLTSLDVSNFNTSNVTDIRYMFSDCSSLTSLDLSNFDTSKVWYMISLFNGCSSLTSLDISNFKMSNVIDMGGMFSGCSSLSSLDFSAFNTSNVTNMSGMFSGCSSLSSLDFGNFNTSNVKGMGYMFEGCSSLTSLDVSTFNTSNVTDMGSMFYGCSSLASLDLSNFNTSNVTNTSWMFYGCSSMTSLNLDNFNTSNVTNTNGMFSGCSSLTSLDVSNFNTSKVTTMESMFCNCSSLTTIYASESWSTTSVTSDGSLFGGCRNLIGEKNTAFDANHIDTEYARIDGGTDAPGYFTGKYRNYFVAEYNATEATLTFKQTVSVPDNITTWDAENTQNPSGWSSHLSEIKKVIFDETFANARPTSCAFWFTDATNLTTIEGIEYLNTNNVTNMRVMFYNCIGLTELDLSHFNTENVTLMAEMFYGCRELKRIYVSDSWVTTGVTNNTAYGGEDKMFVGCEKLQGGMGTSHSSEHVDISYARIDGGTDAPGYFTGKNVPTDNVTLTAKSYTREYGEANPAFEYDVTEGTITDGAPAIACEATATSLVGTYDIVISKGSVTNSNVTLVNGTLTVTKAPLTISCGSYTIEQGEALPDFTLEYSGWKNDETEEVLTTKPTITCEATKDSEPGTYDIIVSGTEAQNYEISYVAGKLTITARKDNATLAAKSYTREYGEANPAFEYDVTEGTITDGTPELATEATATSPVGTYDIVISKGSVSNNEVSLVNGTLTITKAPLTISCGSYTIEQGEALPDFALEYSGWKNDETEEVLTTRPVVTCEATKDSEPGTYDIIVSGAEAENYEISYVAGTLTIEAKPIVIEPVEVETEMKTEELSGQDLSNNVVNDVYYNIGEDSYDSSDGSIVISQPTNMSQIANREPGSADVKENFNGMILKVAKGKGLITVNVKTSGNAQLVVQVGNGTPMLATKTEKGDVVFRYDVEEDTYVYIYAIIGSSAAKGYGLSAADTDSSVRIYSITVSPGATGIRSIGASERNDGNIYDLQGHRVETPAKGIYIIGGRKVAVK